MPVKKTRHDFQWSEPRMPVIKFPIKRSTDNRRGAQGESKRGEVLGPQSRVGVMKNEDIAGCLFRAEIHLGAAVGRVRIQVGSAICLDDRPARRIWLGIDDNNFVQFL